MPVRPYQAPFSPSSSSSSLGSFFANLLRFSVLDVHDEDGHREEERVLGGKMCLLSLPRSYFLFPLFLLACCTWYLTMRATYQIHFMLEPWFVIDLFTITAILRYAVSITGIGTIFGVFPLEERHLLSKMPLFLIFLSFWWQFSNRSCRVDWKEHKE